MPDKVTTKTYWNLMSVKSSVTGDSAQITTYPVNTRVSLSNTRSDPGPNKDWKRRIRNHQDVTSNLSGTKLVVKQQGCNGSFVRDQKNSDGKTWTLGNIVPYRGETFNTRVTSSPAASTISRQNAETIAISKFHRRIQGLTKDFDGFVFLGELKQTLQMLRNPFQQLFRATNKDYILALKRKSNGDVGELRKVVAGTWLEFMYGVKPLLSDLDDAADAWSRLNWDPLMLKRIRVSGRDIQQLNVPVDHFWSTTAGLVFTGRTRTYLEKQIVYRGLWARTRTAPEDLSTKNRVLASLGLEMRNFVPAVWNLLPWSFLADYVTNLGDILEQRFTSFADMRYIVGTRVDRSVSDTTMHYSEVNTAYNNNNATTRYVKGVPGNPAKLNIARVSFQRTAIPVHNFPVNGFQWELPSNPLKYCNVLALAASADALFPQKWYRDR